MKEATPPSSTGTYQQRKALSVADILLRRVRAGCAVSSRRGIYAVPWLCWTVCAWWGRVASDKVAMWPEKSTQGQLMHIRKPVAIP